MKKVLSLILALLMVMSCVIVTATAADTAPELVYTVDFRGNDGKFAPAALEDNARNKFVYTPSADGKSLTVTPAAGAADIGAFWGGKIQGLTANKTTAYTMIYQVKAHGTVGTDNSLAVGGWIQNDDLTVKDSNVNFYGLYGNHNTQDAQGATNMRKSRLALGKTSLHSYVMNDLSGAAVDTDGFITLKVDYNGGAGAVIAYVLAKDKTGASDSDWIKLCAAEMTMDATDDSFGFLLYNYHVEVNTTIKNVQIYKRTVTPAAEGTYTPNTSYDLKITEICNTPEDARYEYIEIKNTSANSINLKDYYIFRLGFSHGGKWEYSGLQQMLGKGGNLLAKLTAVSLADYNVTLAAGELAIIWFASPDAQGETVAHFKSYWKNNGADESIDSVKIVRYENYVVTTDTNTNTSTTTIKYPASYINVGVNNCNQTTFLPDSKAGFAIGLMKASKANSTLMLPALGSDNKADASLPKVEVALKDLQARCDTTNCTIDITHKLHQAFDSVALCYTYGSVEAGYSWNYYGSADVEEYAAATANPSDFASNAKVPTVIETTLLTPAFVWGQAKIRAYWNTSAVYNTATATEGALFADYGTRLLPSPGKLWDGQFGTDGDIPSFDAAKGETSIVVIRWTPDAE